MKYIPSFIFTVLILCLCASYPISSAMAKDNTRVKLETTQGDIIFELYETKAPATTRRFLTYVRSGFYDDTLFHRVLEYFMIQGGGYAKDKTFKQGIGTIKNEADNGLKNLRGTVAMARSMEKDSATTQFFINLDDNKHLDHRNQTNRGFGYAVFAKVVQGMDVADKISQLPVDSTDQFQSIPANPVIIQNVSVLPSANNEKTATVKKSSQN